MTIQNWKNLDRRSVVIWSCGVVVTVMLVVGVALTHADKNPLMITSNTVSATTSNFILSSTSTASQGTQKIAQFNTATTELDRQSAEQLVDRADLTQNTSTSSGYTLNIADAQARTTVNGEKLLHIPFQASAAVLEISGATFIFDQHNNILSSGEVVFTEYNEFAGKIELWQDGEKIVDRAVSGPSVNSDRTSLIAPAFHWGTLNTCLGNANISSWAIAAIGISCGVVCGATLGVGCLACVIAISGVTGGTIGHCVAIAM